MNAMPTEKMVQGAYVQAWVWLGLCHDDGTPLRDSSITDEEIVNMARDEWAVDGELEIDAEAEVSRSDWEECDTETG